MRLSSCSNSSGVVPNEVTVEQQRKLEKLLEGFELDLTLESNLS